MAKLLFRYSVILAILYLLLFIARDQKSTFFLIQYTDNIKILSGILLVLSGISYVLQFFLGGVQEISGKKCVRCNRPALKGFIYCHEHLRQANKDVDAGRHMAVGRK